MDPEEAAERMERLVAKRAAVFANVTSIHDAVKNLCINDFFKIQSYTSRLSRYEDKYLNYQEQIENLNWSLPKELRVDTIKSQASFLELIVAIESIKQNFASQRATQPVPTPPPPAPPAPSPAPAPTPDSSFMLPKIHLPSFNGDIEEWPEFISVFNSLVHDNANLDNAKKFQYLKTSLKGEPSSLISQFKLTAENYPLAYKALQDRYQNQRRIASMYLNKIMDFKPITSPSLSSLKAFLNIHQTSVHALNALEFEDFSDFLLFSLAYKNLDSATKRLFENKRTSPTTIPTYKELVEFITQQVNSLELNTDATRRDVNPNKSKKAQANVLLVGKSSPSSSPNTSKPSKSNGVTKVASYNYKDVSCPVCKSSLLLLACPQYLGFSIDEKYKYLTDAKRCFNCLGLHPRSSCRSKGLCRVCHKNNHHTSLHNSHSFNRLAASQDSSTPSNRSPAAEVGSDKVNNVNPAVALQTSSGTMLTASSSFHQVLLGTARILIEDHKKKLHEVRAVLDPGSQVSAITQSCASRLNLKINPLVCDVSGIGQVTTQPIGIVNCHVHPPNLTCNFRVKALVLPKISNALPSSPVSDEVYNKFKHLPLADKDFGTISEIDVLLGADVYPRLLVKGGESPIIGNPSAVSTCFGWVILGPVDEPSAFVRQEMLLATTSLADIMKKFWELEEISAPAPKNPDDQIVEGQFVSTHSRDSQGRYIVALPFKPGAPNLQSNKGKAKQMFLNLEDRLLRAETYEPYHKFMSEYESLKHMSLSTSSSEYVIPHHVVTKASSSTSKFRVVFNASYPDCSGVSLNDRLFSGPKLQRDICDIIMSFRIPRIALCADIEKMYRQVLVRASDRCFQHIYWRPSPDSPVQEYELNTVTYGVTPAAYLAIRTLHQLVSDEGDPFPEASHAILHSTYVDDVITGADSVESAVSLRHQLCTLLQRGCFQLRKFASNEPEVLQGLSEDQIETNLTFANDDLTVKILGLSWDPRSDSFMFSVSPFSADLTKRNILSYIARIFDPVGFLAPVILSMKVVMQRLWLCKVDWDDAVPPVIETEWSKLSTHINLLAEIRIPRTVSLNKAYAFSLVGFCDASERAYSASVYICSHTTVGTFSSLWKAKTKLAPLKVMTIPRLELNGAVLLSELVRSASNLSLPSPLMGIRLFSDSEIVLSWLLTPPHHLKTYVANRVVRILENVPLATWSHINSELNPADLSSRGLSPEQFVEPQSQKFWLHGPPFLMQEPNKWPVVFTSKKLTAVPETKTNEQVLTVTTRDHYLIEHIERFSSFAKLRRVFAYINRFICNLRARKRGHELVRGTLAPQELHDATLRLVYITQNHYFASEHRALTNKQLPHKLASLSPFIDSDGLVRVGGRLTFSNLEASARHPLLLPKEAHLSKLLCYHFHLLSLHSGPNTTQALIRAEFWILSLRSLLRKCIHECKTCHRFRGHTYQPLISPLPPFRVQPNRPFNSVGVDYAGPFNVRSGNPRKPRITKGYLCLFICMASKAVHLEFASELSTEVFIACLERFVSRRGLPHEILSDCGKNFVGASRYLNEVHSFLQHNEDSIRSFLAPSKVNWRFNPPYAPHFGGLWEAGVKSAKSLLVRMIGSSTHTFENYCTLFSRIEAVLNSRPLCPLSEDPSEAANYLSPGHFLIGSPILALPEVPIPSNQSLRSQWQLVRQRVQHFWQRWTKEYLNTLIQRRKWHKDNAGPKIGDIVLVKGLQTAPLEWPMARIIALHPGGDGVSRVATIKIGERVMPRAVSALVPLEQM